MPADPPVTTAQPAPTVPDPAPAASDVTPSVDTAAPTVTQATATKTVKTVKPASAAKPVPMVPKSVTHSVTRTAAPAPAIAAATTITTQATSTASSPSATSRPTPIIDLNAKPSTPTATTAMVKPATKKNETLPIAGGALAFLAIGGAAVVMARRRDDDGWDDETIEQDPVAEMPEPRDEAIVHDEQPAIVAPSAFAWGGKPVEEPGVRGEDETHVERAYRGPTIENPSVSLRTRLKRAAFMDKREREVAAGLATPVEPTAGLSDRLVDEKSREHELA